MRRLILQMHASVDGFMSAAVASPAWQLWGWGESWPWDAGLRAQFNETFEAADTIVLSRKMAEEGYLDHWGRIARLAKANTQFAFAQRIVDMHKVVLTNNLDITRWPRTRVARGTIGEVAATLKRQAGKDMLCFGGVGFGSALLRAGVVDELQLYVNPVALGAGESIYGDGRTRLSLRPLGTRSFDCGMVVNTYQPGQWTRA